MEYTDRVEGFQIRDVTYFGLPPAGTPPTFDIVKWESFEPRETMCMDRVGNRWVGEKRVISESCFSVGMLVWDRHEGDFRFESVGLRWLEEKPSDAVIQMILDFAEKKCKELAEEDER